VSVPGIVGIITKKPEAIARKQIVRMLKAIKHEPFYGSGQWADASSGVYVGWSSLKGSFSSEMPVVDHENDVALFFSGQEYSDPQENKRQPCGGGSTPAGEASYLLQIYRQHETFCEKLNGLFHGLVVDRKRGLITLFNDRYGMHRLCYHESEEAFYFAAEANTILAVCPWLREADLRGLGEFVACSCVLENRTIFKNIYTLPGASRWVFRNGALESKHTYFAPQQWEDQAALDSQGFYEELRRSLATNLPRYFAGPERAAITMTGGLDTRVILACHPREPGSLPSYTFGGTRRESQDVRVGRRVARISRQPHHVIEVGNEFLTRFPQYAERSIGLTEGMVDVSRASDLYVSGKAREIAPAKIVGTYGSEILRQAVMFKPVMPQPGLFAADFMPYVQGASDTYAALRQQDAVTFAAFRQSPWFHQGILALERSQLSVRSPFLDNDFVRTVYRAPKGISNNTDVRLRLIRDGSPELGNIRSDRGVGGAGGFINRFINRALQEFTFKAEYAYDYGMPQWVARADHVLSGFRLERLFLGRHKFQHFRVWYRDQLSNYVREMLLDPLTLSRPYLRKKTVEGIVKGHLEAGFNYTTPIHKLLTLELLHRLFFDAQ
jgi:asparagine synthase (glutamine-hydrolysing)